jgi:hypothetical protein
MPDDTDVLRRMVQEGALEITQLKEDVEQLKIKIEEINNRT